MFPSSPNFTACSPEKMAFFPLFPWNKWPCFPVPQNPWEGLNTHAFIDIRDNDARTVHLLCHALANLKNSNTLAVYGQKHKVWVLVFLVRTSGTCWDQNWADLVKYSVSQQNRIVYSNSIQGTLLSISSNGLGKKTTVISCLFVV